MPPAVSSPPPVMPSSPVSTGRSSGRVPDAPISPRRSTPPLLAEYDAARAATGGLGAVALHGRRVEGAVQVSPAEHARIAAAPPDAVIHAEENDVILVRMGE